MAAVTPTTSSRCSPRRTISSANTAGPRARVADARGTGHDVEAARLVHLVGLVVLGRCVAEALARDAVDDDRATETASQRERVLERFDVVPVDRPEVLQPEILEQSLRRNEILDAALHPVQRVVDRRAHDRGTSERVLDPAEHLLVPRTKPKSREPLGETTDGRCVRAAVVVHHDDDGTVRRGDVVQRLPAHPAGQRAVADDGDDRTPLAADRERLGQPVRVGQRGGRMRVLDPVVLALGAVRVAGQPAGLAQSRHAVGAPGDDLVDVRLVPDVEQDRLGRRVEAAVQREGEFDGAEVRVRGGRRYARWCGRADPGSRSTAAPGPRERAREDQPGNRSGRVCGSRVHHVHSVRGACGFACEDRSSNATHSMWWVIGKASKARRPVSTYPAPAVAPDVARQRRRIARHVADGARTQLRQDVP